MTHWKPTQCEWHKSDFQIQKSTLNSFAIKCLDDRFTFLFRLHASKANTTTRVTLVTKYPCWRHWTVCRQHVFEITFSHVHRQVGKVQVCQILLLLLHFTHFTFTFNNEATMLFYISATTTHQLKCPASASTL